MSIISQNITQKTVIILRQHTGFIVMTFLTIAPLLALLSYLYPVYAPLLFLTIGKQALGEIQARHYYALLFALLSLPLTLMIVFCFLTISIHTHVANRKLDLMDMLSKTTRIIAHTLGSLWAWMLAGWFFTLTVKLATYVAGIHDLKHVNSLLWASYIVFYLLVLELTRPAYFAIHYFLLDSSSWQNALDKSRQTAQKNTRTIRIHDIILTLLHLLVPMLVQLFALLTQEPASTLVATTLSRLGILFFIHITFAAYIIIRFLLFKKTRNNSIPTLAKPKILLY